MNLNELRLGNLVNGKEPYSSESKNFIVKSISEKGVNCLGDNKQGDSYATDIKGIELTEEWLLKFGFEERVESDNFSKWGIGDNPQTSDWMLLIKQFKDENIFFYNNGHHKINHVHQLQNLYHALTGQEL